MSNFSVSGVNGNYSYTSANIYSYLGRVPSNEKTLERAFKKFDVIPTGNNKRDLTKLNTAMYEEYSAQVKEQIANQNNQQVVPWASLCAQIGVQATGNYEKDYAAFNEAIKLLSQSAVDGQAMAYFAGLRSEASKAFGLSNKPEEAQAPITFAMFQAHFLS